MNNANYSTLILGAAVGATVAMLVASRKKFAYLTQSGEGSEACASEIMHRDEEILRNEVKAAEH
jgi:hypothetical protein